MPHAHAPQIPSQLRESHTAPSESSGMPSSSYKDELVASPPAIDEHDYQPVDSDQASVASASKANNDAPPETGLIPTIRSRLFGRQPWNRSSDSGGDASSSLRPDLHRSYGSVATMDTLDSRDGYGGPYQDDSGSGTMSPHGLLGDAVTDGLLGAPGQRTSNTQWLAKRHGVKHDRAMYVAERSLPLPQSTCPSSQILPSCLFPLYSLSVGI
jgi:hypothetical protein